MIRPRCLDLFCGAGGAARGLQRAGFDVTGVDIKPQPRYAGDRFIQGDALDPPLRLSDFDFIWASPPCQAFSSAKANMRSKSPDLIEHMRVMLKPLPVWCMENVVQAPLRVSIVLDGTMFGLNTYRRRAFECSFLVLAPSPLRAFGPTTRPGSVTIAGTPGRTAKRKGKDFRGSIGSLEEWRLAMDMPWADAKGVAQAIPPAYSEHIGKYALMALGMETATIKVDD